MNEKMNQIFKDLFYDTLTHNSKVIPAYLTLFPPILRGILTAQLLMASFCVCIPLPLTFKLHIAILYETLFSK